MRIFKDIFTGKEILTDTFPMKLVDDFVYVVDANYRTKAGDKFGDEMFGGNPSAEDGGDDLDEPNAVSGFDVILDGDLEEYHEELSLKQFLKVLKKVIGFAKEKIPSERFDKVFKPKMTEFFSPTGPGGNKDKFKNFQIFFSTEHITTDLDIKAGPVLLDADDTGLKAKMYFFKDLMEEEKV